MDREISILNIKDSLVREMEFVQKSQKSAINSEGVG
jgi:hypothetical protein